MARRPPIPPAPPAKPVLSLVELQQAIARLEERRAEIAAFDVRAMTAGNPPELKALEAGVARTLEKAFGESTADWRRFSPAARLSWNPPIRMVGLGGRSPITHLSEFQANIASNIQRSLPLLDEAIRALREDLSERQQSPDEPSSEVEVDTTCQKIFLVHGHDDSALQTVARFLEKIGLEAIILKEQTDEGRTIIEKFEAYASEVAFAVVLLTPDDVVGAPSNAGFSFRARQNVIFELGYFSGRLGRGRACLMRKGEVEIPSDLYGVIYTDLDASDGWKLKLVRELKAAGLDFDANKVWS